MHVVKDAFFVTAVALTTAVGRLHTQVEAVLHIGPTVGGVASHRLFLLTVKWVKES